MAREMCALMCMRSFSGAGFLATLVDQKMDLPELPHGVRYGSERKRNIAETSMRPDENDAKIIWDWWRAIFLSFLFPWWPMFQSGEGEPVEIPIRLDEDLGKKKWYRLDKIVVSEAFDTWYDMDRGT
jgi:hypothetical protein